MSKKEKIMTSIKKYLSKIGRKGGSVSGGRKAEAARANAVKARAVKTNNTAVPAMAPVTKGSDI